MSRYHLTSTSRALYRVFVAPNLVPRPQISIQHAPACQRAPFLPITSVRTKMGSRKPPAKRQAISDLYTFDRAIHAEHINLIDLNGDFHPNIPMDQATRKINRVTHHILLVSDGKVDEFGRQDPNQLPTCKVISKMDLRNQYNRKIDLQRKAERGPVLKNLELNWAIAEGDLKHRLEKLKEFLRDGRKVEVVFGPKRRGKKATDEEIKNVLKAVEEAALDCKGTGEVKREGVRGGVYTIVYQGTSFGQEKVRKQDEDEDEIQKEEGMTWKQVKQLKREREKLKEESAQKEEVAAEKSDA